MSITTKLGDKGETTIYGRKVKKNSPRIKACGAVDELNSHLGLILSSKCCRTAKSILNRIQNELFIVGSDLSMPARVKQKRITKKHVDQLTKEAEALEKNLEPLSYFILPGGCKPACQLHIARTVCRRAEQNIVELNSKEKINPTIIQYANRLSDMLFLLARLENKKNKTKDIKAEF